MAEETTQSNPEATQDAVFGSQGNDFFEALENDVNGAIQDETQPSEVTPTPNSGPEQVTHVNSEEGSNNEAKVDWEQRYKDSTREAQRMHQEMSDLKPFIPVLDAMKNEADVVSQKMDMAAQQASNNVKKD